MTVDELAQIIRRVDGDNSLGAGALAEAIFSALSPTPEAPGTGGAPDEATIDKCLEAMAQATVTYPAGKVSAPLIDWFQLDAQDAVDFGVLTEPKFDGYSDIAVMQQEWYVEALLRQPFMQALKVLFPATPAETQADEVGK